MQNRYNFAQDTRISIRGFGARSSFGIRGVKILVDGIPESLPDGQAQSDAIDLGSAEQIEVLRGPASSMYGNASGGMINITTESGPKIPFAELQYMIGDFGFAKRQLKVGGDTGPWNYLVNLSIMDLEGFRAHSETENTQINARVAYSPNDHSQFGLILNATDQPIANDPGAVTLSTAYQDPTSARQQNIDFDAGESIEQQRIGLTYKVSFSERHEIFVRNYFVSREFRNRLPFVDGGVVEFERIFFGGGGTYSYNGDIGGLPIRLVAGADFDQQDDDRRRFDNNYGEEGSLRLDQNEVVTSIGLFAQAELKVKDKLSVMIGARHDSVEFKVLDHYLGDGNDAGTRLFSRISPMLGTVWSPTESASLYATVSTAFETPTTTELANPSGAGGFNPTINPQLSTNHEVGFKGAFADRGSYEISVFDISVEDELIPYELASQPGREFFRNAGSSSRQGAEVAFATEVNDRVTVSAAYTYSDFRFRRFVDDAGNDYSGNVVPGIPEEVVFAELSYVDPDGPYAIVELLSVGDLFVDNENSSASKRHQVLNLRLGIDDVRVGRSAISVFLGANNLNNEKYPDNVRINAFGGRHYEPAPERNFYAGVAIRVSGEKH